MELHVSLSVSVLGFESGIVGFGFCFFFPVYLNPCLSVFTALPPGLRILC